MKLWRLAVRQQYLTLGVWRLSLDFTFSSYTTEDALPLRYRPQAVKLLAPELFFLILAHPVYKMWIIQEPNTLELLNKLHFEEKKKRESIYHV